MTQVARQLSDPFDGALRRAGYLIMDRDTKFTDHFKATLRRAGIEPVVCPPRAPNCNPYAERFVRSVKEECLAKVIPIGVGALRHAVGQYLKHYNQERNHQGLGNRLIAPVRTLQTRTGAVQRHERVGGLLSYYYRKAA